MHSRSRLIVVGLVTLLAGLILFFPARVAYQWFAPDTLSLSGIGGSVWNGQAREASVSGVYLHEISWQFQPLSLLSGKLAYAISARPVTGFVDARVALGITGDVSLVELQASLSLEAVQDAVQIPGLRGNVTAQFERLEIDDGLPVGAEGVLEVAGLVVPSIYNQSIGGYRAEFFTQESGVIASIEDTDGVIDLAGSLHIAEDRNYEFVAQLAPKNNTPAAIREQMRFLGSANERGQHELRLEGKL